MSVWSVLYGDASLLYMASLVAVLAMVVWFVVIIDSVVCVVNCVVVGWLAGCRWCWCCWLLLWCVVVLADAMTGSVTVVAVVAVGVG